MNTFPQQERFRYNRPTVFRKGYIRDARFFGNYVIVVFNARMVLGLSRYLQHPSVIGFARRLVKPFVKPVVKPVCIAGQGGPFVRGHAGIDLAMGAAT
jgi:hypothetical protein